MRLRIAALAASTLIACSGGKPHWTPRSATQSIPPTVKSCVLVYEDDIQRVKDAGGTYAGKVTVFGRKARSQETQAIVDAREKAAESGGTHCVVDGAAIRSAFLQAWPGAVAGAPGDDQANQLTLLVLHVPEANWSKLPEQLRPKRVAQEFQW